MGITYHGRRTVKVAKQSEGRFPPGSPETTTTAAYPQFQGQQSQEWPRDDRKYDRANIGGGRADDIPPTDCREAYTPAQRRRLGI